MGFDLLDGLAGVLDQGAINISHVDTTRVIVLLVGGLWQRCVSAEHICGLIDGVKKLVPLELVKEIQVDEVFNRGLRGEKVPHPIYHSIYDIGLGCGVVLFRSF